MHGCEISRNLQRLGCNDLASYSCFSGTSLTNANACCLRSSFQLVVLEMYYNWVRLASSVSLANPGHAYLPLRGALEGGLQQSG